MSYSNYASQATKYREREIVAASPAKLVVIVYDHVLSNLMRARVAGEAKNLEVRLDSLSRARAGLMELLGTLDVEKGGALGENLRSIYGFVFTQLMDEARNPDAKRLERLTAIVTDLRDAFAAISTDSVRVSAA
jgi:flagellar protein FliS